MAWAKLQPGQHSAALLLGSVTGLHHLAAPLAEVLDHLPGVVARDLDGRALVGLAALPVDLLHDDVRLAHGELISLAAHVLDEDP